MKPKLASYFLALVLGLYVMPVFALGVYKWTDEAGVVHYSQTAPEEDHEGVEMIDLEADPEAGNGLGISEEDDPEGYQAHREEMDALWADIEEKRERARERRDKQERTEVVYVQSEPQNSYVYPWHGYRPPHKPGRPPHRPQPLPAPEPVNPPTSVLDPLPFRRP